MSISSRVTLGLVNPKSASNVASIARACGCYGAHGIFYTGQRYGYARDFQADTQKIHQRIPVVGVDDLVAMTPQGATRVAIEFVEGAIPLPEFEHPDNAYYLFGPEDGSLSQDMVSACQHVIYIPTSGSMNLGATANVVLYDRLSKSQYPTGNELIRASRDKNNRLKAPLPSGS